MKEEIYIAPANFKRGRLIFGLYHISDLVILAVGTLMMIVGCILCFNNLHGKMLIAGTIFFLLIGGSSWILTARYTVYHNIFGFLMEFLDFLVGQKVYTYEGVIDFDDEKERKR